MKTIKLTFCLFIFVSCTSQTSQNNTSSIKEEETNIEKNSINTVYIFENDTIRQTVELSLCNEKEIAFKLISQNKQRKQESKIEGIAKNKGGDIELDEDAEGNAYPVNEYIYEKECWLAFRIDRDTKTKMRINEADCDLHNLYCPFASVDFLVKR
jgi:hypothetical protein